jgi:hypothetical protein
VTGPGIFHRARIAVRISSGTLGLEVRLSGFSSGVPAITAFTATTSWQVIETPPFNTSAATSLTLSVGTPGIYTGFGGLVFADAVLIESTSTYDGTFFDGDSASTNGYTYAWTGTANASQSTGTRTVALSDVVTNSVSNPVVSKINGTVLLADTSSSVVRNISLSTTGPTGGMNGDVWIVYS